MGAWSAPCRFDRQPRSVFLSDRCQNRAAPLPINRQSIVPQPRQPFAAIARTRLMRPRTGAPPGDEPKTFRRLVDFREVKNNSSELVAAGRPDDEKAMCLRAGDGWSKSFWARLDHSPIRFQAHECSRRGRIPALPKERVGLEAARKNLISSRLPGDAARPLSRRRGNSFARDIDRRRNLGRAQGILLVDAGGPGHREGWVKAAALDEGCAR